VRGARRGEGEPGRCGRQRRYAGQSGFTLLEVILSLLIIGLLAGAALVDFGEFHRHQQLKEASGAMQKLARSASRSAAAWNADYWIRLEPRRFFRWDAEADRPLDLTVLSDKVDFRIRRRFQREWKVPEEFDWYFPATGVCEPLEIRFSTDDGAYVELMFNPLTGSVDEERAYFP